VLVNSQGVSQTAGTISTTDGTISFYVAAGTKMLDGQGNPLTEISAGISTPSSVPPPPLHAVIVTAYDFTPAGSTFVPSIALTLKYNLKIIPSKVNQHTLFIAYWDGHQWQSLPSTVNTSAEMVTAQVPHFTDFALIGKPSTASSTTPLFLIISIMILDGLLLFFFLAPVHSEHVK
jgi:hypothetical protein